MRAAVAGPGVRLLLLGLRRRGSTAERQDQVQTLAFPLSIPILVGYIFSITVASSGNPDLFFKVLAYLPPTAPFCMSVLVALNQVTWWQFVGSVLISIVGTVGYGNVRRPHLPAGRAPHRGPGEGARTLRTSRLYLKRSVPA